MPSPYPSPIGMGEGIGLVFFTLARFFAGEGRVRVLSSAALISNERTKSTKKIFHAKHAPDRHPWIPASAGMTDPGNAKIANFRQTRCTREAASAGVRLARYRAALKSI